jgi:APA family basic amino acid/polyamine antiporter
MFGNAGLYLMAAAIMISAFGCCNGLILAGARVYYAMARDKLFFASAGTLHARHRTPAVALMVQGIWIGVLCLSGTYSQLLDFVIFAAVLFYTMTAVALFSLRARRPQLPRPVRAPGYPWLPALYIVMTTLIAANLLFTRTTYAGLGLFIVLLGVPVYFIWRAVTKAPRDLSATESGYQS